MGRQISVSLLYRFGRSMSATGFSGINPHLMAHLNAVFKGCASRGGITFFSSCLANLLNTVCSFLRPNAGENIFFYVRLEVVLLRVSVVNFCLTRLQ